MSYAEDMTPVQKQHIRESFTVVVPIAVQAAGLFYSRLFELDPGLQPLLPEFPGDSKVQCRKLVETVTSWVNRLDDLDGLMTSARLLGERHHTFGVREAHFETVAIAMMWTLQAALGPVFTPAVREAWAAFYRTLADSVKEGARSVFGREPTRVCAAPSSRSAQSLVVREVLLLSGPTRN